MLLKLLPGLLVGLVVGILALSMFRYFQKNKLVLFSRLLHWMVIGSLMPYISLGVPMWVKGALVGGLLSVPWVLMDSQKSRYAAIHTAVFSSVWGIAIVYGYYYLSKLF